MLGEMPPPLSEIREIFDVEKDSRESAKALRLAQKGQPKVKKEKVEEPAPPPDIVGAVEHRPHIDLPVGTYLIGYG